MASKFLFGRKRALVEGVLAGTFFGTAAIFIRLLEDIDVFAIAFWRKVPISSLMLFIYILSSLTVLAGGAVARSAPIFSAASVKVSLALIGLGVLPTALAHTLYFSSLSGLKSFETATLALLEPITATLFGVFIFAEIPHLPFVLGVVFVLGGIVSVAAGK